MQLLFRSVVAALTLLPALAAAVVDPADPGVSRDLQQYLVLGLRAARVKNISVLAPGCHIGANCPSVQVPGACGVVNASGAIVREPGMLNADRVCADGQFYEVFRSDSRTCGLSCSMIERAGSAADCTSPFSAPILPDLDGDNQPSCSPSCVADLDDIAAACGVTLPLTMCDRARPVRVDEGQDCSAGDTIPRNGRCDLAPGRYGDLYIADRGQVVLGAGETVVCNLLARRNVSVTSTGPATIVVPETGRVNVHNGATFGTECHMLRLIADQGRVRFSHAGSYTLDVCVLRGKLNLGGRNRLRGSFLGEVVGMDRENTGECCPIDELPVSTTTTTTTTTTTSSTLPFCGNGRIDPGEECDGGDFGETTCPGSSTGAFLQCTPDCLLDFRLCESPPVTTTTTTTLPTTTSSTTTTTTTTTAPPCGNGRIDDGEECDGTEFGEATCPGSSTGAFLQCTPACRIDTSFCPLPTTTTTTLATTTSTTVTTTTTTTTEPPCGNGRIDGGEECDGTEFGEATCPGSSTGAFLECTPACRIDTSLCPVPTTTTTTLATTTSTTVTTTTTTTTEPPCGNGRIDDGEECDGTEFGEATCPGSSTGAFLECTPACQVDTSLCPVPTTTTTTLATTTSTTVTTTTTTTTEPPCGNGRIDDGEECDGTEFGEATCPGSSTGAFLQCTPACQVDTSLCPVPTTTTTTLATTTSTTVTTTTTTTTEPPCGNGRIDDGEECDGTEFGEATCPGSSTGAFLQCTPACQVDTSLCPVPTTTTTTLATTTSTTVTTTTTLATSTTVTTTTTTATTSTSRATSTSTTTTTTPSTTTTTVPLVCVKEVGNECTPMQTAPCSITVSMPGGTFTSLQAAVDAAQDGATLTVRGVCQGGAFLSNRHDLTIEGIAPTGGCPAGGLRGRELLSTINGTRNGAELIKTDQSSNITVRYLNLAGSAAQGIEMKRATGGLIECNCLARSLDGVEIEGGDGVTIRHNLVVGHGDHGIKVNMGTDVTSAHHALVRNCIVASGTDGIQLDWTMADLVSDNTSRDNVANGISILGGTVMTEVTRNKLLGNGECGIEMKQSDHNFLNDNVGSGSGGGSNLACCSTGTGNTGNNVPAACR